MGWMEETAMREEDGEVTGWLAIVERLMPTPCLEGSISRITLSVQETNLFLIDIAGFFIASLAIAMARMTASLTGERLSLQSKLLFDFSGGRRRLLQRAQYDDSYTPCIPQ